MTLIIHQTIFWIGFQFYRLTKKTLSYPYYSFRKLFVLTRGRINDNLSGSIQKNVEKYNFSRQSGVLGDLSKDDVGKIVSQIDRDGYYVFEKKLPDNIISQLRDYSLNLEAVLVPPAKNGTQFSKYDAGKPLSARYQFEETVLMGNNLIQELTTDLSLLAVAQEYLGTKPIQDLTAMWWSTSFSKQASSEAAQLYHFDMDRIKFIKFFFYLTDVTTETGPHCYIRGSHKCLPEHLWKDGRILDREIEGTYKMEDIIEIDGPKGSIIAVDTRGLHKGKALEKGERLILQFEFTNSLFGAPYQVINLKNKISPDQLSAFKTYGYTFQRFKF